jgi:hypothetical protein
MVATKTKLETAKDIARFHYEIDDDLRHVFLLGPVQEDDANEPIKLLEVRDYAVERWIEPLAFPSNAEQGIPFPYYIVEISPREFSRVDPTNIPFRGETWRVTEELPR